MKKHFSEDERLADGSAPLEPSALLERLAELGIEAKTVEHAPVFTVEEAKALRGELEGAHIKNLFLRNKKGRMWLVTCLEDREVDLKALGELLEAGRFSFGSAERLMSYLGVRPGAVTPLAVVNDKGGAVTMVLDKAILDYPLVNAHPLVNHMTTALTPADLLKFLEDAGHSAQQLDMSAAARAEG
ncbi:prolyl-tRNA synthetase associated domain-containing protein [Limibacillus halophilus]